MNVSFQLKDTEKVPYRLVAVDADGNPASLDAGASVSVSSSDLEMAQIVADATSADGTVASGFIVAGAKLGTVQISAAVKNADGTDGPTGSVPVDIVSGPAAKIAFTLGTPVAQ